MSLQVQSLNLGFDRIDALSVKRFNPKILFDPFEEQCNLPPAFVIVCNLFGVAVDDIGKQNNILIIFRVDQTNPPQGHRITMLGLLAGQPDDLVAFIFMLSYRSYTPFFFKGGSVSFK